MFSADREKMDYSLATWMISPFSSPPLHTHPPAIALVSVPPTTEEKVVIYLFFKRKKKGISLSVDGRMIAALSRLRKRETNRANN